MLNHRSFSSSGEANMKRAALVAALGLCFGVRLRFLRPSEDIVGWAKEAQTDAKDGNALEAYDTVRKAALQVWQEGPLLFRKALFVSGPPTGFGIYDPRSDNVFKTGEKLVIYVEPVGFAWKEKNGLNHAQLVADLALKDGEGSVVGEQKAFGTFTFDSHEENMEVMTALTIDFTDAPPGKYTAELKFNDEQSDKTATFELPFEIEGEEDSDDE